MLNRMNGAVLGGLVAVGATFSSAASSVTLLEQPAGAVDGQIDRMFQSTELATLSNGSQFIVTDFIRQERSTITLEDNGVSIVSDIAVESFFDENNVLRFPMTSVTEGDPATDASPVFVFSIDQPHRFEFSASLGIGGEGNASATIFRLPEGAVSDGSDLGDPLQALGSFRDLEDEARAVEFSFSQGGSTQQGITVDGVSFFSTRPGSFSFFDDSLGTFMELESLEDFVVATSSLDSLESTFPNQGAATGVLEAGTFAIFSDRRNFTGGTFGRTSSSVSFSFSATLIESGPPAAVPTPTAAAAGIVGLGVAGLRRRRRA